MNRCHAIAVGLILLGQGVARLLGELPAEGAPGAATPARLPVVILPFENRSGDPAQQHWSRATAGRIETILESSMRIRAVPGARYGMRRLALEAGGPVTDDQARRVGELTEARWVVTGSWNRLGGRWLLDTRLVKTAGTDPATAAAHEDADWFAAVEGAADNLLEQLGVDPGEAERREMAERPTRSLEAYELFARASALGDEKGAWAESEAPLRQALEIDPGFLSARGLLATALLNQGKIAEGEEAARRMLDEQPDSSRARNLIGQVLLFIKDDPEGAEKELHEAIRLEPDFANAHGALGRAYAMQERWEEAAAAAARARELDPFDPMNHILLGSVRIRAGKTDEGLVSLRDAERLEPDGVAAEVQLGIAYRRLADYPDAARHFERALELARDGRASGIDPQAIEGMLSSVRDMLNPTPVEAARPRTYSPEELQAEIEARLTPEELALVEIPFAIDQPMKDWVREATADAGSDLERAQALFKVLVHRVRGRGKGGARTARQVFELWDDPETTLSCQEYGKLFVGLGREIGLDAFYVHLEKDCSGRVVYHDCAAIFIEGKAYLVDPAYRWFGVPHREFEILDDLQTVAHHLFQHRGDDQALPRCRAALGLHPDHAWGRVAMARACLTADQPDLAEQHLARADELEPMRWDWHLLRGIIAAKRGDDDAALRELRDACALNPENPEVQFFLGMVLTSHDRHEEALDAFRAAVRYDDGYHDQLVDKAREQIAVMNETLGMLEGDPQALEAVRRRAEGGDAQAQNNLAVYLTKPPAQDWAAAERWARRAIEQENWVAHDTLGIALMGQQRVEEAIASFREAIERVPDHSPAHLHLGSALLLQGKPGEAVPALQRAIGLDPDMAVAHHQLGFALASLERFDDALPHLRRAIELDPASQLARKRLAHALLNLDRADNALDRYRQAVELEPANARAHADLGRALVAAGDGEQAVAALQRAVELDPELASAHDHLGVALMRTGRHEEAAAAIRRAIELDPNSAWAFANLAVALSHLGRHEEATAAAREAVALDPEHAPAWHVLGSEVSGRGQLDEALEALRKASELDPEQGATWNNLGLALLASGEHDDAAAAFRRAADLDPDNAEPWVSIGGMHLADNRPDEAAEASRKAVEIAPEHAGAWQNLGIALYQQGRHGEAIEALDKASELEPDAAGSWLALGASEFENKDWSAAIPLLRRATELDPDNARAWGLLGGALSNEGMLEEAVDALRKATGIEPDTAFLWDFLGITLSKLGERDDAIAAWRRALELEPRNTDYIRRIAGFTARANLHDQCGYWLARLALRTTIRPNDSALVAAVAHELDQHEVEIPVDAPSDEAIRDYYEAHRDRFEKPAVHLLTVSIPKDGKTRGEVEAIHAQLADAGDFGAVAREHSDDWAADDGGDRGWVERGDLRRDLEDVAFTLESGQLSGILEDETHYRLLKVVETRQLDQPSWEAAKAQVVLAIQHDQRRAKIMQWLDQARRDQQDD